MIKYLVIAWSMVLLPILARAEDTVPVVAGEVAPFTGLLVPEDRFFELLQDEIDGEKSKDELELERKLRKKVEEIYAEALKEADKPPKFYQTPRFNQCAGFTVGVVFTTGAIWAGTEIVKATR